MSKTKNTNEVETEVAVSRVESGKKYSTVIVKAGTTLLTRGGERLNLQVMSNIVEQIAKLRKQGIKVIIVTSGAVAAGRHILGITNTTAEVPFRQVLAAAGQGRLMQAYEQLFDWHQIPVAQALLSRKDLIERLGYLNIRNTLLSLLELDVVPIINENDVVAVDELVGDAFGDNDNLSAMVANLVDADLLVMLGQVEGLFTADPNIDSQAKLISTVEKLDNRITGMAGGSWGNTGQGGMSTKLEAAQLATACGVDVVIASGLLPDTLIRLSKGQRTGTFFPATASKMESRKRWMLSGLSTKGQIVVDSGAVEVVWNENRSLLPAGITHVRGEFERGDIVAILDHSNKQFAVGITNYKSADLEKIKGHRSKNIESLIGHEFGEEVVHKNNMVKTSANYLPKTIEEERQK